MCVCEKNIHFISNGDINMAIHNGIDRCVIE